MGERQWVKRFTDAGRVGAYLRVVRTAASRRGTTSTASLFRRTVSRWASGSAIRTWRPWRRSGMPTPTARSACSPSSARSSTLCCAGWGSSSGRQHRSAPGPCAQPHRRRRRLNYQCGAPYLTLETSPTPEIPFSCPIVEAGLASVGARI